MPRKGKSGTQAKQAEPDRKADDAAAQAPESAPALSLARIAEQQAAARNERKALERAREDFERRKFLWTKMQTFAIAGVALMIAAAAIAVPWSSSRTRDAMLAQLEETRAAREQQDQLIAANRQLAEAAQAQASGIAAVADAARQAAEAARTTAEAARNPPQPASFERGRIITSRLELRGLKGEPDTQGLVGATLAFSFANVGRGGVTMTEYSLAVARGELPAAPIYAPPVPVDEAIAQDAAFQDGNAPALIIDVKEAPAIASGTLPVLAFGWVRYRDETGAAHRTCFAYRLVFTGGDASTGFVRGPSPYWCEE